MLLSLLCCPIAPRKVIFTVLLLVSCNLLLTLPKGYGQKLSNINNPVLPGVADAGVVKFNGEYYIGGVFTNGSFYISKDLIKWEGPVHVFSMDNDWTEGPSAEDSQIHANDINYINGVFHQYWSVNYWGKDQHVVHTGHATSPTVLGPYKEPVRDNWFDNRIDPELFVDDDGTCYFYTVKFTDGNTIWGRRMKDPWTLTGEPKYLFASLPNTWETLDNRVEEGPWVIKYRNRYYLMYNTNHTSTNWGNYALGVAEADSPLAFNHGNKYPYPVVESNQIALEDTYVDLLKHSPQNPNVFLYSFEKPDDHWKQPSFNAVDWQKGKAGFGSTVVKNSTARKVLTSWITPNIWLRKTFSINKKSLQNVMLRIHHDGETQVFLNGQSIYLHTGKQFTTWNLDADAKNLLKEGENVLAIRSIKGENSNFLDVALFDMQQEVGDDILYTPGQPNILRGPNGFEWWLIYMANKNAEKRGQFINRVHFFDKQLVVDGLTSTKTPGYHPAPAMPTFKDLFDYTDSKMFEKAWHIKSGKWEVKNKEAIQTGNNTTQILLKSIPASHYLFETGLKMNDPAIDRAGVYAYWKDDNNWLQVVLDQKNKKWAYIVKEGNSPQLFSFNLPPDFNFNVYHTFSVFKNAGQFFIKIDDLPAPVNPVIKTNFTDKGIPGLFTQGANVAFDGVVYTIGWDEFDTTVTGWGSSGTGIQQKGSWAVSEEGISQSTEKAENFIFKGDALEQYEVSLQVTAKDNKGSAGIYPVYIDGNNYLKAVFDFAKQKFMISGKRNGKEMENKEISLHYSKSYYADMKYSDFIEKHFTFTTPTYIDAIKFNKSPHTQPDTTIEDIFQKVTISYRQADKWHPITSYQEADSPHPAFEKIKFDPLKVEELRLINKQADDLKNYIYQIGVDEVFKQSYNLRVAKLKNAVIFIVDGKEILRIKNSWPASQVGLITENTKASFNGITFFQLPLIK